MVEKRNLQQQDLFGDMRWFLTLNALFTGEGEGTARALKPTATCVYLCLRASADYVSGCSSVGVRQIARACGISPNTCVEALKKLEDHNLISKRPNRGKKRAIYQLNDTLPFFMGDKHQKELAGALTFPHKPRELSDRLQEAKEFLQTRRLPPAAKTAGVKVVHNHYHFHQENHVSGGQVVITQDLSAQRTLIAEKPMADSTRRALLSMLERAEHDEEQPEDF